MTLKSRLWPTGGPRATALCGRLKGFGLWRSLASALAWGARGPGFKSRQPDQKGLKPYTGIILTQSSRSSLIVQQLRSKLFGGRKWLLKQKRRSPSGTRLYGGAEAAHYLRIPASTLRRWVSGRLYAAAGVTKRSRVLIHVEGIMA